MKIETLIAGRSDTEQVQVDDQTLQVGALKALLREGYSHVTAYKENRTFSVWGKNCTACFTAEQLQAGPWVMK